MGLQKTASFCAIACFYFVCLPLGSIFAIKLDYGVFGLWMGVGAAVILQCLCYALLISKTDWQKVADEAINRISKEEDQTQTEPTH